MAKGKLSDLLASYDGLRGDILRGIADAKTRNAVQIADAEKALERLRVVESQLDQLVKMSDAVAADVAAMQGSAASVAASLQQLLGKSKQLADVAGRLPALIHSDLAGVLGSVGQHVTGESQYAVPDDDRADPDSGQLFPGPSVSG